MSAKVSGDPTELVQPRGYVLGMRVDATSLEDATRRVLAWSKAGESRYVCVANVHMVMESYDAPNFRKIVNAADLVTPDGMPLVWMLRRLGFPNQERVAGPDLTLKICEAASREGVPVGFYGGTPEVLQSLATNLKRKYSALKITYAYSPPFRPLTPKEDAQVVEEINGSGTRILFVGLGCPKQERWMAAHKGRVQAVMIGVGAAFDFHAGRLPQAPAWMRRAGLEWLFRLLTEPWRLWRRYARHNPRFVILALMQLLGLRKFQEA